jgi:tetratricopeptide (TPR) repeat protein
MHRADCAYELADYEAAVKLYEQAAREINDPPQVVAANIQIANAYFALHKPDEARSATERAKQLLHKLPAGNGSEATVPMPAGYFEQWLKWTGSGGTW